MALSTGVRFFSICWLVPIKKRELGVVTHICNPNMWEAEAGVLWWVWSHSQLNSFRPALATEWIYLKKKTKLTVVYCSIFFHIDSVSETNNNNNNKKRPLKIILIWKVMGTHVIEWHPHFSLGLSPCPGHLSSKDSVRGRVFKSAE